MEIIKEWLEKTPAVKRYTLFGFFFGLLFPIVGAFIEFILSKKTNSFQKLIGTTN